MTKALAILGQILLFVLLLALFAVGGLLGLFHADPFHTPRWFLTHPTPTSSRYFVPSGLLLMTCLYVLVLALEAAAKRLRRAGPWTTLAFVLALLVGLLARFGWITTHA